MIKHLSTGKDLIDFDSMVAAEKRLQPIQKVSLAALWGRAHALNVLNKVFLSHFLDHSKGHPVDPSVTDWMHVLNINKGVLVVAVDSSARATRLQIESNSVLQSFQSHPLFASIDRIKYTVQVKKDG